MYGKVVMCVVACVEKECNTDTLNTIRLSLVFCNSQTSLFIYLFFLPYIYVKVVLCMPFISKGAQHPSLNSLHN